MNVLEKILEEMKKIKDGNRKEKLYAKYPAQNKRQEILNIYSQGYEDGTDNFYNAIIPIIRSHMGDATDTDDTEEKIREHIAECLHRIDNIRRFAGSKEYTSKCIRNIEVLKTSITVLEEYLSSKKKNGNNGWIPVEDGLPEVREGLEDMYCPEFNVTIKGAEETTTLKYSWDGTWFDDNGNIYDVIAWRSLPEPYKPKKDIEDSGARS